MSSARHCRYLNSKLASPHLVRRRLHNFPRPFCSWSTISPVNGGNPADDPRTKSLRTGLPHSFVPPSDTPGREIRDEARAGRLTSPTAGLGPGLVQANMVIVPAEHAFDFLTFCLRNPKPCPLLDMTAVGDPAPTILAPSADLRTDLPRYCVWRNGKVSDEPTSVEREWDEMENPVGCEFFFPFLPVSRASTIHLMRTQLHRISKPSISREKLKRFLTIALHAR